MIFSNMHVSLLVALHIRNIFISCMPLCCALSAIFLTYNENVWDKLSYWLTCAFFCLAFCLNLIFNPSDLLIANFTCLLCSRLCRWEVSQFLGNHLRVAYIILEEVLPPNSCLFYIWHIILLFPVVSFVLHQSEDLVAL